MGEPQTDPTDLGTHRQLLLGSVLGLLLPQLSHWLRLAPDHVPAHRRPRSLPHQRRRLRRLLHVVLVPPLCPGATLARDGAFSLAFSCEGTLFFHRPSRALPSLPPLPCF